jgi:nucleoside-diphosphate-sugar epimerase
VESGIPHTIYRPGIVVGDSRTGVTAKFDGPYFALNAIRHLPSPGVFMKVGSGTSRVNLVPVDFVLEAIARLSSWNGSAGKTYHLTDPAPLSAFDLEELLSRALGKSFVYLPVPLPIAKLLFAPRQVQRLFGMPSQTLDYFDHPVDYDAAQATHDLGKFGVVCPRFSDYAQTLIRYYLQKAEEGKRGAMV